METKIQYLADAVEIIASNSNVVNQEIVMLRETVDILLKIAEAQTNLIGELLNEN